jgi:cell division protein FtsW (lipid II flippase)
MEIREKSDRSKLVRARRRVAELKGFYTHLMVYIVINTLLVVVKLVGTAYYGETFMGPFWHFSTFGVWLFWGIGLAFHAVKVFSLNPIFGKEWEEKQIQKFIEKEKNNTEKFR